MLHQLMKEHRKSFQKIKDKMLLNAKCIIVELVASVIL